MRLYIKLFSSLFFIIFLSACGVSQSHYANIEKTLTHKNYKKAEKLIKKAKKNEYGKKNALLYYLNLGWVYHLARDSKSAEELFTEADRTIAEQFTKHTSDDVASVIGNDNNLPFRGEDFEKIMLTIIRTLDYSLAGNLDDARVEVMKVDNRMRFLNQQRGKKKATYTEDAFAHYLSGLIYESEDEDNDAYMSYLNAYKFYKRYQAKYGIEYLKSRYLSSSTYDKKYVNAYITDYARSYRLRVPMFIKQSLKRLMKTYARDDDLAKLEKELSDVKEISTTDYKKMGQFIFIHYNGYAPKKVPVRFRINPSKYGHGDISSSIDMEYPSFRLRYHRIAYAKVNINGNSYITDIVEPIDRIAVVDLMDRIGGIWAKMIARRIGKYIASQVAGAATGDKTFALLGNLVSNLSEQADLRSWRIIPAEIGMVPISLPPGTYNATITFHSLSGMILDKTVINNIKISPNKKVFKMYRTIR